MVFRILQSMEDIEADEWQSLVQPETSPFLEYYWLQACECSGSMCLQTGWQSCHVLGFDSASDAEHYRRPIFALPLYIKYHSWGEFVFDFGWADAFSQMGKDYYPKAVGLVPATPVTAYEALAAPGFENALEPALHFIREQLMGAGVVSLSFHFTTATFSEVLEGQGYHRWLHSGFEWDRAGMRSFNDYLAGFGKNQRKNIRKERKSLSEEGLSIKVHEGEDLNTDMAKDMYALYSKTNAQFGPWAAKFFNENFFERIFRRCSDRIIVLSAENSGGECIARSLLVHKNGKVHGRYWGSHEFVKNLHFDMCYYEPIDLIIRKGFSMFDPGMGGEHKIRRGFKSVEQYSMHSFFDPHTDAIFAANIPAFNTAMRQHIDDLNAR